MTSLAASTFVWFFILIPLLIVWVLGVADILRRPISATAKAAWILLVVLLPFAGTLLTSSCANRRRRRSGWLRTPRASRPAGGPPAHRRPSSDAPLIRR
jgi:hypothetical protein